LKPGGHALVWALPRTSHWTATAWENAGFEVRDRIGHIFGQGFPKSLDVSKAIDKEAGVEREITGRDDGRSKYDGAKRESESAKVGSFGGTIQDYGHALATIPSTPSALQWDGWGTALKPAVEDWWLLRKPISEDTVAANVLKWGTGAINVDGCRVEHNEPIKIMKPQMHGLHNEKLMQGGRHKETTELKPSGRFPAHLIHDGSEEVMAVFPETGASNVSNRGLQHSGRHGGLADIGGNIKAGTDGFRGHDDNGGSAARFFYTAKASRRERNRGLDNTCTVKHIMDKSNIRKDLSCKDVNTVLVQSLARVTSDLEILRWSTGESGESITGRCPSGSLSIMLMEIRKITTSQILNSFPPLFTNAFIAVANCEKENGGSPAENAGQSNPSTQITTSESQASALGASLVVSQMLSTISDAANWKKSTNTHSTVKPLALMEYLVRLITPPNGIVLDCFCGSGTTLIACVRQEFKFIGIDSDPEYAEIAKRRVARWSKDGKQMTLASTNPLFSIQVKE
jgi:hypothetical protein